MKTKEMRFVLQREHMGDFSLRVPKWIGDQLGETLVVAFDGETLTITGV
jgi:hypothetical protein